MSSSRLRNGRHLDREDVEPVEQVFAEPAQGHRLGEIQVGGGDHAAVGLDRVGAADAFEPPILEHPQQLGLHAQRHLADLVEKERAPLRQLEPPFLLAVGAGERPALVTEQLALEQLLGERRTVDRHQRAAPGDVAEVDRLGDQLLARARLARHQDRARRRRDPRNPLEDLGHARTATQQVMVGMLPLEPVPEIGYLVDQPAILEGQVHQDLEANRCRSASGSSRRRLASSPRPPTRPWRSRS